MSVEANRSLGVSVVIATRGRIHLVGELLQSLQVARNQFHGKQEVVVVDDSPESGAEQLATLCDQYDAKLLTRGPNVTSKRNYGAEFAQNDVLVFLDSDCVATPQLLSEHERCYSGLEIGAVVGLLEFVGPDSLFWKAIQLTPFVMPFGFPKLMEDAPWGPSANLSVRKNVFDAIGGFDETFPQRPGGEDVDLGLRISKAGYRIRCNPNAVAYHSKETWIPFTAMCRRLFQWGVAECYLMERHPDQVVTTLPRKSLVFIVTVGLVFVAALVTGKWRMAAFLPLWIVTDVLIQAMLQLVWAGRPLHQLFQQSIAVLLVLVNELGMVKELIHRRRWRYWTLQMLYTPGQMEGEWHFGGSKMWGVFFGLCFLLALILIS